MVSGHKERSRLAISVIYNFIPEFKSEILLGMSILDIPRIMVFPKLRINVEPAVFVLLPITMSAFVSCWLWIIESIDSMVCWPSASIVIENSVVDAFNPVFNAPPYPRLTLWWMTLAFSWVWIPSSKFPDPSVEPSSTKIKFQFLNFDNSSQSGKFICNASNSL